ncbi:centrosomal protein of 57 kDa-like [Oscarella lobularis]|uniref:centrosomal protein of 57 kDa-like n=1 Tax=Oscarella lobularis TaxID=121494 RepID=UPI0033144B09
MDEAQRLDTSMDPSMVSYLEQPLYPSEDFAPTTVDDILGSRRTRPTLERRGIEEGNAEAVLNALKSLQDKIRGLEMERARAADRFRALEREAREFRAELPPERPPMSEPVRDRERDPKACTCFDVLKDRLESTEAENVKLSAAQALTDSRIRELEEQLFESQKEVRIHESKRRKKRKKAKSSRSAPAPGSGFVTVETDVQTDGPDMPFVVGTSTAPSHSVTGNVQQTLAMMKRRNMPIAVPKKTVRKHSCVKMMPPGEVKVVTTVKAERGAEESGLKRSLELLKGVKMLQTALKRSDLHWE